MDAQEATIISTSVTGAVAVVAGIGSAWLTSWVNRKNTKETLAAAERTSGEHWQRSVDREHEVWLRGAKQAAYADFLAAAEKFGQDLTNTGADVEPLSAAELTLKRSQVEVLGSYEVREIARSISRRAEEAGFIKSWYSSNVSNYRDWRDTVHGKKADAESPEGKKVAAYVSEELNRSSESLRRVTERYDSLRVELIDAIRLDLQAASAADAAFESMNRRMTQLSATDSAT